MSHQIYRIAFVFLFTLGLFTGNTETFASVPPHPRIAKLLKEKKINTPYYLKNRKELLKRGVNAPWASPSIQKQSLSKQIGIQRSFGAASSPHGSWKALVLLVQFTDKAQNVNPAMFDSLLFGNSARSLRDYYKAVSFNYRYRHSEHAELGWLEHGFSNIFILCQWPKWTWSISAERTKTGRRCSCCSR